MQYEDEVIARACREFARHEASYTVGVSGIDVLDFRRPDSGFYALRVVFDRQRGDRVYISGDLGEAVVYPTCPATLRDMAECFTARRADGTISANWGYFMGKIRATSDRWYFTAERFWSDFREQATARELDVEEFCGEYEEAWLGDGVEIDNERGVSLSSEARRDLNDIDDDYGAWIYDCGRRVSPRIILWLVALRLACEAVEEASRAR